jgi:hypothetical protein
LFCWRWGQRFNKTLCWSLLSCVLTACPVSVLTSPLPLCVFLFCFVFVFVFFFLFSNVPGPDSLQKSELQPYSVQVWFQGQY